jgi:uncharacterized protein YdaU (DUF1376 family)
VNYFELHIGDYEAATAHLSLLEDAAYCRMLRIYYRTERPLPTDVKQVFRLVRAVGKPERDAVQAVLDEFFELRDDGWHQARCDAELAAFHEREPEREAKRKNAAERQQRARARRTELFDALRGHNIVPPYDTSTKALEALLSRVTGVTGPVSVTDSVTCDNTATHLPPPTSHLPPPTSQSTPSEKKERARAPDPPPRPEGVDAQVWADWLQLRRAKKAPVTPTVVASASEEAVKAGLSLDAFLRVWCTRGSQGLQADWLTPQERHAQPAAVANGRPINRQLALEAENRRVAAEWLAQEAAKDAASPPTAQETPHGPA